LLFSWEIVKALSLKHSTIKNYLRELTKDGYISQDDAHRYCSNTTYGVLKPLLVHNLRLKVIASCLFDLPKIEDSEEETVGNHFWVQRIKRKGPKKQGDCV